MSGDQSPFHSPRVMLPSLSTSPLSQCAGEIPHPRTHIQESIGVKDTVRSPLRDNQQLVWETAQPLHCLFRNPLQHFHRFIHRAIENVCAKYQAEVPHAVHLANQLDLLAIPDLIRLCQIRRVPKTNRSRLAPTTSERTAKVFFPVDDDEIERHRRCDGGK